VYGTDQSLSDVHDKLLQDIKRSHRSPYWSEAPLKMIQLMPIYSGRPINSGNGLC
jgi:hypothetical protein